MAKPDPTARRVLALALLTLGRLERFGELALLAEDEQALREVDPELGMLFTVLTACGGAGYAFLCCHDERDRERLLALGAAGYEQPDVEALAPEDAALLRHYLWTVWEGDRNL